MVPGPERTLIVFAYCELTQKIRDSKGRFVAEGIGVRVGLGVIVSVCVSVGESVTVGVTLAVGLRVVVAVCVGITIGVKDGMSVGVAVGVIGGWKRNMDRSANKIMPATKRGIQYKVPGKTDVLVTGTTGSPVYPNVVNNWFRLAA